MCGNMGATGNTNVISPGLKRHFDKENAKVEQFMSGKAW